MNREILFRGKRKDNGMWEYGNLSMRDETGRSKYYIGQNMLGYEVLPETVGQYTGLTDKYGNKIFEGDVFDVLGFVAGDFFYNRLVVEFIKGCFYCVFYGKLRLYKSLLKDVNTDRDFELNGNIHDNPELVRKDEGNEEV